MKSIFVTGASSGIGAAIARLAVRDDYAVGLCYRSNRRGAEEIADAIRDDNGKVTLLQGDVCSRSDISKMFRAFHDAFGQPSAVVNNAGIVAPKIRFEDMDEMRMRKIFHTNVIGPFMVAQEAIRRMANRNGGDGGVIVNISSVAAKNGSPDEYVDYAASKGAIDSMTIGLAHEMAREGVRVVGVRPGIIRTSIHAKGGAPDRIRKMTPKLPMKRAGTALEVAETVLWLASDAASYVTGTTLDVSGGR